TEGPGNAALCWHFSGCVLDEASLRLSVGGQVVELERKPLEVLRYLLRHAGEVVTKDEVLEAVWPGRILSDTVLAKAVS
ncbi:winged helix-turn-helix domain-containing protein, partial [Vibrio parahaemolyticus]